MRRDFFAARRSSGAIRSDFFAQQFALLCLGDMKFRAAAQSVVGFLIQAPEQRSL